MAPILLISIHPKCVTFERYPKYYWQMDVNRGENYKLLYPQHEYDDIIKWYEELANRYTDIVTYYPSIGKSYEGRDMPAVHITGSTAPNIFKIYFQCQIHASKLCLLCDNYPQIPYQYTRLVFHAVIYAMPFLSNVLHS